MAKKLSDAQTLALAAAVLVVAGFGYLGWKLMKRPDEARIIALIEERLNQRTPAQASAESSAPIEKGGAASVDKRASQPKAGELSDKEFNARVEKGIVAFVEKQRQAQEEQPSKLSKKVPPPGKNDHVYGNANAAVTLIEYSDFECPYCKSFHATAKRLVDESQGQVNWVYRHFPLDFHNPGAQKEAEASECAAELGGNDVFWKYSDAIYTRTRSNGKGFPVENLSPLAAEVGLDKAAFDKCLDSGKYARKVEQQLAEGQRSGVNGTPGNILFLRKNGEVIAMHGAQPYERFRAAVDALLAKSK